MVAEVRTGIHMIICHQYARIANMAAEIEYQEVRTMATSLSGSVPDNPCCKGNAVCCTIAVPVIPEDGDLIKQAIAEGRIPKELVDKAIENAKDKGRKDCPFLNDSDRTCGIYQDRPLTCAFWGVSGAPASNFQEIDRAVEALHGGEDPQVGINTIIPYSCDPCRAIMRACGTKFPVSTVAKSLLIADYVSKFNGPGGMSNVHHFVLTKLEGMSDNEYFQTYDSIY